MVESTFLPPPPLIPPDTRKHSIVGIASFAIGIVAVMIFCLALLFAFGYGIFIVAQNPASRVDQSSSTILVLGLFLFISPLLSLVGVGMAIGAIVPKTDKKLFGILGLVLNLLIILVFCALVVIGVTG